MFFIYCSCILNSIIQGVSEIGHTTVGVGLIVDTQMSTKTFSIVRGPTFLASLLLKLIYNFNYELSLLQYFHFIRVLLFVSK